MTPWPQSPPLPRPHPCTHLLAALEAAILEGVGGEHVEPLDHLGLLHQALEVFCIAPVAAGEGCHISHAQRRVKLLKIICMTFRYSRNR